MRLTNVQRPGDSMAAPGSGMRQGQRPGGELRRGRRLPASGNLGGSVGSWLSPAGELAFRPLHFSGQFIGRFNEAARFNLRAALRFWPALAAALALDKGDVAVLPVIAMD